MGIKRAARSWLTSARVRIQSIAFPPAGPFRPDLGDAAFIGCLSPASHSLLAAKKNFSSGDMASARRQVVEHFVRRTSPRFFCDRARIGVLSAELQRDRKSWVDAVVARVDSDLNIGLPIASRLGAPLAGSFDWEHIPPGPGNDDLYTVQPHRFGFMPRLALAAHHGVPTLETLGALMDRWIAATDKGFEMSYLSPLVVTYRVLALTWTFALVAGLERESDDSRQSLLFKILKILRVDAEFLANTIGESYPNNHLLADGFAGWYCGTLFPEFPAAVMSREKGEAIFVRELDRQFLDDGSNFEHSTHYHELGCEMAAAYVLLSRRNDIEPANSAVKKLERMLAFQAAICGPEALPLPMGDCTEDPLFPLDAEHGWGAGAMRELYRALFDPTIDAAPANDVTVERAFWLLGGALAAPPLARGGSLPMHFDRGGLVVLTDIARNSRLIFRSGPVEGAAISAGHAHADVLSIYLSVHGVPLIVDAGTYTYRLRSTQWPAHAPDWRSYFAGPGSHNGLLTGADPYGAMSGDFRNRDIPCRVRCTRFMQEPGMAWIEFEVLGANVARGWRRGVVHVVGRYWIVYDLVPQELLANRASIGLQFGLGANVDSVAVNTLRASLRGASCTLSLSGALPSPVVLNGSVQPLGGWVSPRYGELAAAPQVRAPIAANVQPCGFLLQATRGGDGNCAMIDGRKGDYWVAFQVADGSSVDHLLIRTTDDAASVAAWDVVSDGALLWLRTTGGEIEECRRERGKAVYYRGKRVEGRDSADINPTQ